MKKYTKVSLVLKFLRGNLHFFIISIVSALLVAGLEMLSPQLIRVTVDSVIGNKTLGISFGIIEILGGTTYLKSHIWAVGLAIRFIPMHG